jgi:carbonic anhydrase/acetyltransferase-like protein (isoleucine patch superfamily)
MSERAGIDPRIESRIDPRIDPDIFVAPTAQIFGNVEIGAESSVWANVVIRAECQYVRVGRYTNLQDFVMIHVGFDHATEIGDFCSITHHSTIHGCKIEDDCLVGINAVVMDGAMIGPGSIIAGVPAKQIGERDSARANRRNAWVYHWNAEAYKRGDHRAWTGPAYERWILELAEKLETDADLTGIR